MPPETPAASLPRFDPDGIRRSMEGRALWCRLEPPVDQLFARRRQEEFSHLLHIGWPLLVVMLIAIGAGARLMFPGALTGSDGVLWWQGLAAEAVALGLPIALLHIDSIQQRYQQVIFVFGALLLGIAVLGTQIFASARLMQVNSYVALLMISIIVLALRLSLIVSALSCLSGIVLAVGTSHAYGAVAYRVTAIGASTSSLLLLHFVDPHPLVLARITDTLIGAGLSWAFSFLLPHWERYDMPGTVRNLLKADAQFAASVLHRHPAYAAYRLGRKKAIDAVAALSGALRRLADEPNVNRRILAALNELLAANYLLASDLSSMPVLLKLRQADLDRDCEALIDAARTRVLAVLSPQAGDGAGSEPPPPRRTMHDLHADDAKDVLARRLEHIEHAARKVARLSARPILENL